MSGPFGQLALATFPDAFPAETREDAAPLNHVGKDKPPFFVTWGDDDPPNLRIGGKALAAKLEQAGVKVKSLEVKDRGGLRCGIAILHRIDRSVHIVGAGRPVGNGKDEVSCRVGWGVQPAQHSHRDGTSSPDLLYVVAGWDQGGWLVWNGTTYVWVAWN